MSGGVMEVPGAADAEAEAFFAHEGAAAVFNAGAGGFAVPVEGGG
jgi:hypothetical protein